MTGHEAQQILDALKHVEKQVHARIDRLDTEVTDAQREVTTAINGMRDRHHDGMNVLQSEIARLSIASGLLREQLLSHQRLTDTAMAAISGALDAHVREEGHGGMLTWRANVTGKAVGLVVGITLAGGATASGLTLLIQNLVKGPS